MVDPPLVAQGLVRQVAVDLLLDTGEALDDLDFKSVHCWCSWHLAALCRLVGESIPSVDPLDRCLAFEDVDDEVRPLVDRPGRRRSGWLEQEDRMALCYLAGNRPGCDEDDLVALSVAKGGLAPRRKHYLVSLSDPRVRHLAHSLDTKLRRLCRSLCPRNVSVGVAVGNMRLDGSASREGHFAAH